MAAPKTSDGRPRVAYEKPNTPKTTVYSHDWTDPTTWYQEAVRIVDEVATDSGDHTTYSLEHQNVIDTCHGLIFGEDFLADANGHSFRVTVKVDGVTKVEVDPHTLVGDYTINYAAGTLTFGAALDPGAEIVVTYHHATTSIFTIRPTPGTRLLVDFAEVQFAGDIVITDTVEFQPYGFVDAFAPEFAFHLGADATFANGSPSVTGAEGSFDQSLVGKFVRAASADPSAYALVEAVSEAGDELTLSAPYGGADMTETLAWSTAQTGVIPSGTKIPLGNPVRYKSMSDYQADAVKAYTFYPVLGGDGWRGSSQPIHVFDWDYVSATPLHSSAGMEIRCRLEHDVPFGGWYATATFYCSIEADV